MCAVTSTNCKWRELFFKYNLQFKGDSNAKNVLYFNTSVDVLCLFVVGFWCGGVCGCALCVAVGFSAVFLLSGCFGGLSGCFCSGARWQITNARWQITDARWQITGGGWQITGKLLGAAGKLLPPYTDFRFFALAVGWIFKFLCPTTAWLCEILKLLIRYLVER